MDPLAPYQSIARVKQFIQSECANLAEQKRLAIIDQQFETASQLKGIEDLLNGLLHQLEMKVQVVQ